MAGIAERLSYRLTHSCSFLGLLSERLWEAYWPSVSVAALYSALSLLNIVQSFGDVAHAIVLGGSAAGLAFAAVCAGKPFTLPTAAEVDRKMEERGGLRHRPLQTLKDSPVANSSPEAVALWEKHIAALRLKMHNLPIYMPQPDSAKQDRYSLRHAAFLLLTIGLIVAGSSAPARLLSGLTPHINLRLHADQPAPEVWITPPEYTHVAPVILSSGRLDAKPVENVNVPEGSVLKVLVTQPPRTPRLSFADKRLAFTKTGDDNYSLETTLTADMKGEVSLKQGIHTLGRWHVAVTPDTPPHIAILRSEKTPQGQLKVTYKASDDYGITHITGNLRLKGKPPISLPDGANAFDISVSAPNALGEAVAILDLGGHIWAGQEVLMSFTAADTPGHETTSAEESVFIPERIFNNPLAQRIIADRRKLIFMDTPKSREAVTADVFDIASRPDYYKGDIGMFLALGSAGRRLIFDSSYEAGKSVIALLWDIALRLEDGGLSIASRDLNDALQKLSEALKDKNISKEQIRQMMADVQEKMGAYLQALAMEMAQQMKNGKTMPNISPEIADKFMKKMDIGQMIENMRRLAESGSREDMQKLSESLRNMMGNMDVSRMQEMQQQQMEAMKNLQEMQDLIHRQQALMDKTGKKRPDDPATEEAKEQKDIQDKLGEVQKKISAQTKETPENFDKAGKEMESSRQSLQAGKSKDSIPHQKAALDELQQGLDKAMTKMAQQMQQTLITFGMGMGEEEGSSGQGKDPLGREEKNGQSSAGDVKIPEEQEKRRVQEIIRQLRDRSNDYKRPKVERDYIDRLLDTFD